MITKIINGRIIADTIVEGKSLYIKDGYILDITESNIPSNNTVDAENNYVSAGFIDIHCHGGGGHDFMDGMHSVIEAAKLHFSHGTTTIFPTTASSSIDTLIKSVSGIKNAMNYKCDDIPNILGAHLEGPYLSQNQKGAQNPLYITPPIKKDYLNIINLFKGIVKRWSFAPELPGSEEFCKVLIDNNIIPAIAHSDAVYDDVSKIYKLGCNLVTHLYSGMSTITKKNAYRQLGVIESAFFINDMMVEVIADGCHLPPELLSLIYKIKGYKNICLVTDAMRGAGMPEGLSVIGGNNDGLPCIIEDRVAKLLDRSSFAGSVATADRLVRTMVKDVGIDIVTSVKMITESPAKVMNIPNKGSLKKSYDADIVIFDSDINIINVIRGGNNGN